MKLPKKAKKVFSGAIFDIYQWEQEMFDGSTQTYEMIKRPATLQAIVVDGDKIIIAEEEQPIKGKFNTLLGGRQEHGEEPDEGIRRELKEEAGINIGELILYQTYEPYTKMDWQVDIYIARQIEFSSEPELDPGEKITLRRVSFDEFIDIVLSDNFRGREFAFYIAKMKIENRLDEVRQSIFGN